MKSTTLRILSVVAVSALSAAALGTASAQTTTPPTTAVTPSTTPAAPHGHRGHFGHFGGARFTGSLLRATRQLNLTDEQKASIKTILSENRHAHQPGTAPQGPALTVLGNPSDPGYAAAVQSAQADASARIQKDTAVANEIYAVLSTAQRNALPGVLASIQAKEQARRAQWASRHASNS